MLSRHAWPYLFLGLVVPAFFLPALLDGRLLATGDNFAQNFPMLVLASRAYGGGELPFWDPYLFGGLPFLASINNGVFFPGNLAFLLLPPVAAMDLTVIASYGVAACGLFAFVRALGCGRTAGLAGALAFAFSGFMVAHIDHLNITQAAGLLPWLLWAAERFRTSGDRRYAVAAALLLGCQVLAGHPQMTVFSLLVCLAYTAFRGRGRGWPYVASVGAIAVLGLGLAALQLVPTLAFIPATQRAAISYAMLVGNAVSPLHVLTFICPYFFGGGDPRWLSPAPYWGAGIYRQDVSGYSGLVTLALALVAFLATRRRDDLAAQTWFWAGVATCGLLLALGDSTPVFRLAVQLPVLSSMPNAGRHLLEVDLALAVLGAIGLERLARSARPRHLALAAAAPIALLALAVPLGVWLAGGALAHRMQPFIGPTINLTRALDVHHVAFWLPLVLAGCWGLLAAAARPVRAWRAALVGLVALDLTLFGQCYGWRTLAPQPAGRMTLAGDRFDATGRTLGLSQQPFPYYSLATLERFRIAPHAALGGTRSIGGYGPFIPRRLATAMGEESSYGYFGKPAPYRAPHHAFEILQLAHLRVDPAMGWEATHLAPDRWLAEGDGVYRPRKICPPALRATRWQVLPPAEVDRRVTSDPAFDPCAEALLEGPAPAGGPYMAGPATLQRIGYNHLAVTTTPGPGLVVVSEGYDAGWRAFAAGGRELPVRRANALVLAVELSAGVTAFDLVYEPPGWRAGLALSLASALLLVGWWLGLPRRRAPARQAQPSGEDQQGSPGDPEA